MSVASPRGHTARPHTADVVIEAWAPTAAACYEELVAAFVGIFVATDGAEPAGTVAVDVGPGSPEDLLVLLLEEVIAAVELDGVVPVTAHLDVVGDRLTGSFALARPRPDALIGPVPKGIAYSGLEVVATDEGWRARATVDV